jgi:SAM-dependent methyltransferase
VIGIDVSQNQISQAVPKENIEYRCQPAEDLSFLPSNSVDLITIATAIHWFDIDLFFKEANRVLKPHTGVIAVWTYTLGRLNNPRADALYHNLHQGTLLPYWNSKGGSALDSYQSIQHLFPYSSSRRSYSIDYQCETNVEQLLGFIQSLSACQTYRKEQGEQAYAELLSKFRAEIVECLETTEPLVVSHPLTLYLMRKEE